VILQKRCADREDISTCGHFFGSIGNNQANGFFGRDRQMKRFKNNIVVESHWRKVKRDYLHRLNCPRVDGFFYQESFRAPWRVKQKSEQEVIEAAGQQFEVAHVGIASIIQMAQLSIKVTIGSTNQR
jgi:hypothetical protein